MAAQDTFATALDRFSEIEPLGDARQGGDVLVLRDFAHGAEGRVFPCTRCGACCRNLVRSPQLAQLERGDGVCHHLDLGTNLCRIYETRPTICRVSDMFAAFQDRLAWSEYVALNQQACRELQARPDRAAQTTPRET